MHTFKVDRSLWLWIADCPYDSGGSQRRGHQPDEGRSDHASSPLDLGDQPVEALTVGHTLPLAPLDELVGRSDANAGRE